ncbi:hypothetical protein MAPG_02479 [Magnaporthiopsis poae ATCC 64411]|uniref:Uncharacterized protein n=1 Tax=Magnaporthiopsis poae (strain ATCC 64411 / 73-15) TaxID=644358 RepID=A0A0C4DRH1_MAGP6|nr:hypothetical protein MAPG_02479 [Magnaporthiopsis poae ATCC 64411]
MSDGEKGPGRANGDNEREQEMDQDQNQGQEEEQEQQGENREREEQEDDNKEEDSEDDEDEDDEDEDDGDDEDDDEDEDMESRDEEVEANVEIGPTRDTENDSNHSHPSSRGSHSEYHEADGDPDELGDIHNDEPRPPISKHASGQRPASGTAAEPIEKGASSTALTAAALLKKNGKLRRSCKKHRNEARCLRDSLSEMTELYRELKTEYGALRRENVQLKMGKATTVQAPPPASVVAPRVRSESAASAKQGVSEVGVLIARIQELEMTNSMMEAQRDELESHYEDIDDDRVDALAVAKNKIKEQAQQIFALEALVSAVQLKEDDTELILDPSGSGRPVEYRAVLATAPRDQLDVDPKVARLLVEMLKGELDPAPVEELARYLQSEDNDNELAGYAWNLLYKLRASRGGEPLDTDKKERGDFWFSKLDGELRASKAELARTRGKLSKASDMVSVVGQLKKMLADSRRKQGEAHDQDDLETKSHLVDNITRLLQDSNLTSGGHQINDEHLDNDSGEESVGLMTSLQEELADESDTSKDAPDPGTAGAGDAPQDGEKQPGTHPDDRPSRAKSLWVAQGALARRHTILGSSTRRDEEPARVARALTEAKAGHEACNETFDQLTAELDAAKSKVKKLEKEVDQLRASQPARPAVAARTWFGMPRWLGGGGGGGGSAAAPSPSSSPEPGGAGASVGVEGHSLVRIKELETELARLRSLVDTLEAEKQLHKAEAASLRSRLDDAEGAARDFRGQIEILERNERASAAEFDSLSQKYAEANAQIDELQYQLEISISRAVHEDCRMRLEEAQKNITWLRSSESELDRALTASIHLAREIQILQEETEAKLGKADEDKKDLVALADRLTARYKRLADMVQNVVEAITAGPGYGSVLEVDSAVPAGGPVDEDDESEDTRHKQTIADLERAIRTHQERVSLEGHANEISKALREARERYAESCLSLQRRQKPRGLFNKLAARATPAENTNRTTTPEATAAIQRAYAGRKTELAAVLAKVDQVRTELIKARAEAARDEKPKAWRARIPSMLCQSCAPQAGALSRWERVRLFLNIPYALAVLLFRSFFSIWVVFLWLLALMTWFSQAASRGLRAFTSYIGGERHGGNPVEAAHNEEELPGNNAAADTKEHNSNGGDMSLSAPPPPPPGTLAAFPAPPQVEIVEATVAAALIIAGHAYFALVRERALWLGANGVEMTSGYINELRTRGDAVYAAWLPFLQVDFRHLYEPWLGDGIQWLPGALGRAMGGVWGWLADSLHRVAAVTWAWLSDTMEGLHAAWERLEDTLEWLSGASWRLIGSVWQVEPVEDDDANRNW